MVVVLFPSMNLTIEQRGVKMASVMEMKVLDILGVTLDVVKDHQEHETQRNLRLGIDSNKYLSHQYSNSSLRSKHSKAKSRNSLIVSYAFGMPQQLANNHRKQEKGIH